MFPTETPNKTDYKGGFVGNNEAERFHSSLYQFVCMFCILCYVVIVIVGVIGNSLVIWITRREMKNCVSSMWVLNLAITDLLCNVALLIHMTEWAVLEKYRAKLEHVSKPSMFFNMLTSAYFSTAICVDACVPTLWPSWAKIHRTPRIASILSLMVWSICLLFTALFMAYFNITHYVLTCSPSFWFDYLKYDEQLVPQYFMSTINLGITFAVPFFIISIVYSLVAYRMRTLRRPTGAYRMRILRRPTGAYRMRILRSPTGFDQPFKVITLSVACLFVCLCPYHVWPLIMMQMVETGKCWIVGFTIYKACVCLAYFKSCINPILYILFWQKLKKKLIDAMIAKLENKLNDKPAPRSI